MKVKEIKEKIFREKFFFYSFVDISSFLIPKKSFLFEKFLVDSIIFVTD